MALNINGNISYEGCVLGTFEECGYHDSYYYAWVWSEELGRVTRVQYDSTAHSGGGSATPDATDEVLLKVYRSEYNKCRELFDAEQNEEQAKRYERGDTVVVVKGRKVKKGTVCKVFWTGKTYNRYSYSYEERVGLEVDGERVFVSAENVAVYDWQSRVKTGPARKRAIRKNTLDNIRGYGWNFQ